MSLSILIPCRNEKHTISYSIKLLIKKISSKIKNYEIIVINDFSSDNTLKIISKLSKKYKVVKSINNKRKGLGGAINLGIKNSSKDYIVIFMADLSDDIYDLIKYYKTIKKYNLDAVLGSRFIKKKSIMNYPLKKLIYNRIFNLFVKIIFFSNYNDFTNAFKIYKKRSILQLMPFISENFNIFLEIPLKLIVRKKKYKIIPIKWKGRKLGKAKFKIKELGSKYLFTLLYCFFEKILLKNSDSIK